MEIQFIKSETRRNLIREMWLARGGAKAIVALPVTRKEIRDEAKAVVSITKVDDEIRDEEQNNSTVLVAGLFDAARPASVESESSILLETRERSQLRRDVESYRLAKRMPFAIVLRNHWNVVRLA